MKKIKFSKAIGVFVAMIMILQTGFTSFAKTDIWDGYDLNSDDIYKKVDLVNLNVKGTFISLGLDADTTHTVNGNKYSIHWNDHLKNSDLYFYLDSTKQDWTEYNTFNVWLYSEKATNADFMMFAWCPQVAGVNSYYFHKSSFNWTGWKHFSLPLKEMGTSGSPSYKTITNIRICANEGWGLVANLDSDVYIGEISVEKKNEFDFVSGFYDKETIESTYNSLNDGVALYAGGSNAVTKDGVEAAGFTCDWVNGTLSAPVSLFEKYFGANVKKESGKCTLTLDNKSVSVSLGSDVANAGETEKELSFEVYSSDDKVFVPASEVASLLGLETVTDGKLLAIGKTNSIAALDRINSLGVNELGEIASYLAYHDEINLYDYTQEDCEAAINNWLREIAGDDKTNDITDADIKKRIDAITQNGVESRSRLMKDETSKEIFKGMDSKTSADITTAYALIYNMALAYGTSGSILYKNKALADDIIYALDFMKQNRYNQQVKSGVSDSWKVITGNNWWDWAIGAPSYLIPSLMLVRDQLSENEIKEYLEYFDFHVPSPRMTGANYTDMAKLVIGSALLKADANTVGVTQTALYKTFLYVDDNDRFRESLLDSNRASYTDLKGAGFFTDGSYIIHTLHPHLGSYGMVQFETWADFLKIFNKTKFEMKIPFTQNVANIYENSFKPVLYDGKMFRWTFGRYPEADSLRVDPYVCMYQISDSFGDEVKASVEADMKKIGEKYYNDVVSELSISHIKAFKELMKNESVVPSADKSQNKVYYNSDKVVHIRPNFGAAVSMSSARIFNYESINNCNMDGWYLNDGRTEYYLNDTDANATAKYWASIDKYRLPGTTVDTQERKKATIDQGNEYLSSKKFVGGVSLGDVGVAAMDLESYHYDTDFGPGNPAPAHTSDLTAKKSYFMFDDEIVCLGSAVNAKENNNAEVLTIVDNVLSKDTFSLSGEAEAEPYKILSAIANRTPEAENTAENTIDDSYTTKYAGDMNTELVWDLGEIKPLGFADLSFMRGSTRLQYFKLLVSSDNVNYTEVFSGQSSGKTEENEYFSLAGTSGRYVKFVNLGNSASSSWVSLTNCDIYPPNADGSIGVKKPEIYGTDAINVDGENLILYGDTKDVSSAQWINIGGQCGYVFPKENTENMAQLKLRRTRGNSSCTELWFTHGINPTNSGYAYVLLPGMSSDQTKLYAQSKDITVLINNENIQAVYDKSTQTTGIVFWQAGTFGGITADKPCMVVCREKDGIFEISVSDPTQKLESLNLTIGQKLSLKNNDECAVVLVDGEKTNITYNMLNSVGRSMVVSFENDNLNNTVIAVNGMSVLKKTIK